MTAAKRALAGLACLAAAAFAAPAGAQTARYGDWLVEQRGTRQGPTCSMSDATPDEGRQFLLGLDARALSVTLGSSDWAFPAGSQLQFSIVFAGGRTWHFSGPAIGQYVRSDVYQERLTEFLVEFYRAQAVVVVVAGETWNLDGQHQDATQAFLRCAQRAAGATR